MLTFFRKHQKIFFVFIATVTIISFVFFGTYQAFAPSSTPADETVFQTFDGKEVKRSSFRFLCNFLSSEPSPAFVSRQGVENFLNDGILTKDFFETGLAEAIFQEDEKEIAEEIKQKLPREKLYKPYTHPLVKSLSADAVWSFLAPEIKTSLNKVQSSSEIDAAALKERVHLYLAEKKFPGTILAQVLRYQEQENPSLPPDPRLQREDLSLFGYRTIEDWFGSRFVEYCAQVILNGAALAHQKGYTVTKEETFADLKARCEKVFQSLKQIPHFPFENSAAFLQYYLKTHQIEETALVDLWRSVLLFRRLLEDVGSCPFLETQTIKPFFSSAREYASVEVFQMPQELRLKSEEDLKLFEKYLSVVAAPRKNLLDLPKEFLPVAEIERQAPELVGRRYHIEFASVTKKSLQSKVTVKEMWQWEEMHWDLIQKQFPEFASQSVSSLESLDKKRRSPIDNFALSQIVNSHPEWISEQLAQEPMQAKKLFLSASKKTNVLSGISDGIALKKLLDEKDQIDAFSEDNQVFYKIHVKERGVAQEILSFAEAKKERLLDISSFDAAPIVKAIHEYGVRGGLFKEMAEVEKVHRVAPYRFAALLKELPEKGLWLPIKKEEIITRSTPSYISFDEATSLSPGECSKIQATTEEGAFCYRFLEKKIDASIPMETLVKAQQTLATQAKLHFMQTTLKLFKEKGALNPVAKVSE